MKDEPLYEQVYNEEPVRECPMCGGDYSVLGVLGNREHCRCRDCGWDFSFLIDIS